MQKGLGFPFLTAFFQFALEQVKKEFEDNDQNY